MIEVKKTVLTLIAISCLLSIACLIGPRITASARPELHVHNIDTGEDFAAVQEAIDDSDTLNGHTILVDSGIYVENLYVDKSISLLGENRDTTIIDGNWAGPVVHVTTSNVEIGELTLQNSGSYPDQNAIGIYIDHSSHCRISKNVIENHHRGITLEFSENCLLIENEINNNYDGIRLWYSGNCSITGNTLYNNEDRTIYLYSSDNCTISGNIVDNGSGNGYGICLQYLKNCTVTENVANDNWGGIYLQLCRNCSVCRNKANNNTYSGIELLTSRYNTLSENTVTNNSYVGIGVYSASNYNTIFHNNFINNENQAGAYGTNLWNDTYPSAGNYWSDYAGADLDHDGIGDYPQPLTPLTTPPELMQFDYYPLMGIFSDFQATSEYHVQAISNSTISDFQFNGTAICFNVTGEDGTNGFCRICIQTALLNGTYKVFVNSTEVLHTRLPCSNSTHSYLYFAYTHSTQDVMIIPEFPSILVLPLLMILTLGVAVLSKRKRLCVKSS